MWWSNFKLKTSWVHADDTATCTCELKTESRKLKGPSSPALPTSSSSLSYAVPGVRGQKHFTVVGFPRITKSIKLISYLKIDAVTRFVHFHMTLLISTPLVDQCALFDFTFNHPIQLTLFVFFAFISIVALFDGQGNTRRTLQLQNVEFFFRLFYRNGNAFVSLLSIL